ncbi:MAG: hypothetical protein ROR55_05745 [Devosia sp.]
MAKLGSTVLVIALLLFTAFFANVLAGALRWGEVLNDKSQLLLLLATSVTFVVGILMKEAAARENKTST